MEELDLGLHDLQKHLEEMIDCIRQNDLKLHRMAAFETGLLSLNSLRELIAQTLTEARSVFELDDVSLALVDDSHELRLIMLENGDDPEEIDGLCLLDAAADLENLFGSPSPHAYLGPYRPEFCALGFPAADGIAAGSVALLPLIRRGALFGSLNFASLNPHRYGPRMATDFLDRMSRVLGVCLENTLNFELLRRASLKDMLTGVNNRRFFDQRIGEEIDRAVRSGECLSCLFLDIDHFKKINDNHGHQTGDKVLVAVARHIRTMLRNNDVLARYGGEEFVALLSVQSERKAVEVAERIRHSIASSELCADNGTPIRVHLSIGIATLDPKLFTRATSIHPGYLIGQADQALYRAKNGGRNRVVNSGPLRPETLKPHYATN